MISPGLVSVTFRHLGIADVVGVAAGAGLAGIEWGGDRHVPPGDLAAARLAAATTRDAGLRVACYGSYYRPGERPADPAEPAAVVRTAKALGAPLIRVWAGRRGSAGADEEHWRRVVDDTRAVATMAAGEGIEIAFEYHRNTLTDTRSSAARLLRELADQSNVTTLWQPDPTRDTGENLADLADVLPRLRNVHVFSWTPDRERLPLAAGRADWEMYLRAAAAPGERYALLEFVAGDDPARLVDDAATLRDLLAITRSPAT
jgi:3-dehydroshikimate dehydratase